MELSTKLEAVALIITITLLLFHFDPQNRTNQRYRLFNGCLLMSGITIFLDLVSSWLINDSAAVPLWLNIHLNTLYFLAQHLAFSLMAGYCFYLLFEHSSDLKCLYIATTIIGVFCVFLEIGVLSNYWTHWFFYFEDGVYMRGPLNKMGYAAVGIELCMLVVCYLRHRSIASRSLRKLMHIMPPLILLLGIMQQIFPNILMNGTISSLANLILFISFQSNRIGQDALTGLPNRHTFFQELAARRRKAKYFHLILFYLEDMEMINRKFGIKKGDALLYMVGRYLEEYAPQYQAFRFGNTRFLLCGSFTDYPKDAELVAHGIQKRFSHPWEAAGITCRITASTAHMITDSFETDESHIIDQLEYTLSRARETDGNSLIFFDERLRENFERNQYVLDQVRLALEKESFHIHIQPIYNLKEKRFTTGEALLRLNDENGTPVSPAEFIPLAEKTGLIDEISWLVLKMVCRFLAGHPELPLETISINMSIQQLTDPFFSYRIHSCLNQYGVDSRQIRIEITERTLTESPGLVRSVMAQMAAEGLRFYLDDFGIGYSNLAGMMTYPFETVKLDASLMQNIADDDKAFQVVRLLVELLHNAGFTVVAEGLETKEQVEKMTAIHVDRIQGFYFARPMTAEELEEYLNLTE